MNFAETVIGSFVLKLSNISNTNVSNTNYGSSKAPCILKAHVTQSVTALNWTNIYVGISNSHCHKFQKIN